MRPKLVVPGEFDKTRQAALRALGPIKPADSNTRADQNLLFNAKRTDAGRSLPPYYLVYFLFVDLLGFRNLGQFEKVSWSVPVDFGGQAYLIEHRKFGLGLFAHDPEQEKEAAEEIVKRIEKAVKVARPFFDWLANQAISTSRVNVVNNSSALYARYQFIRDTYRAKQHEAVRRKDERVVEQGALSSGQWQTVSFPYFGLLVEASWLGLSAIEAFFSWTEHALIHVAILTGSIASAQQVADLAAADWAEKFKAAIDPGDHRRKLVFDKVLSVRKDVRNYVAHGAFGKQGEAFLFHSGAGAVPVLLPHKRGRKKFSLGHGLQFDAESAIATLDEFVELLWSGERAPARLWVQETSFPTVMTLAADGTYRSAMQSMDSMREFIDHWTEGVDRSANMDW